MQQFKYKIFDDKGEIHFGQINAITYDEAENKLKEQNWVIIELSSFNKTISLNNFFNKLSFDEELFFYVQFSSLISADITLLKSLEIVTKQIKNAEFKLCLKECQNDIKNGVSFSKALRKHNKFFNSLSLGMIEAGEESGKLDLIFKQLSKINEQKYYFRQDVISTISYPVLLFIVSIILVGIIMIFVYPQFILIFQENNIVLPLPTLILAKIAFFFKNYIHILFISFIFLIILFIKYITTPEGKMNLEKSYFHIPMIGNILKMLFFQRIFYNMSLLLKSGIPLLTTVELLAKTVTNSMITRLFADIWVTLRRGGSISDALKTHDELPDLVKQIFIVGEQTGEIEDLLEKIADYYNITVSTKLKRINMIIEPILLVILGSLITFIMASLLLPMFKAIRTLR